MVAVAVPPQVKLQITVVVFLVIAGSIATQALLVFHVTLVGTAPLLKVAVNVTP